MRKNSEMTHSHRNITSSLVVRRLALDDADAVAELSGQLGYPNSSDSTRKRLAGILCCADAVAFAAVLHGEIAGWIEASVERHLQSPESVVIGGLIVRDQVRGHGIGERLCHEVELWAQSKSIDTLRVRSQIAREEAHKFYLGKGYRKIKTSLVFEKTLA